ncbi:unnamed protein product [Closterium sp. NIES-65]|nr:unnamed protein product [Closterium sp. NIES-65]
MAQYGGGAGFPPGAGFGGMGGYGGMGGGMGGMGGGGYGAAAGGYGGGGAAFGAGGGGYGAVGGQYGVGSSNGQGTTLSEFLPSTRLKCPLSPPSPLSLPPLPPPSPSPLSLPPSPLFPNSPSNDTPSYVCLFHAHAGQPQCSKSVREANQLTGGAAVSKGCSHDPPGGSLSHSVNPFLLSTPPFSPVPLSQVQAEQLFQRDAAMINPAALEGAEQLFQRDAAMINPAALEGVKAALASNVPLGMAGQAAGQQKKKRPVPRTAAGQKWEDPTLTEWPENDHRLFCGDLGNEVNDDVLSKAFQKYASFNKAKHAVLAKAFQKYASFNKAKVRWQGRGDRGGEGQDQGKTKGYGFVVRDKTTGKTKGYGFVSFGEVMDCAAALKEMNGKYVGNRPIKLRKSSWQERIDTEALKSRNRSSRRIRRDSVFLPDSVHRVFSSILTPDPDCASLVPRSCAMAYTRSEVVEEEEASTIELLGDSVIPVVNKLQDIFSQLGSSSAIDLPQVAVVGSQSSGKSSVLESLVGKDFLPRGSDVVTRRPLVLQLVQVPKRADGKAEEWGEFLHLPGKRFTDFSAIRDEIQLETEREVGINKGITEKQIRLKIFSPHVLTITLVDLPGITKVPVGDQPSDIEARVRSMILAYIKHETCIILAVTPANADLANSDALQVARMADPDGHRTIGVITKLDIMDRGTDACNLLLGNVIPLRLGYVGVINRSQEDINAKKSVKDALTYEEAFFRSRPVYHGLADRCGIPQLAKKLNSILVQHIRLLLPDLKARINAQMVAVHKELVGYGEAAERATMGVLLLNILTKYSQSFVTIVDGKNQGMSTAELAGGARIHYIFQSIFVKCIDEVDPCEDLSDEDIRTAIQNATGTKNALFVPDVPFEVLVRRQISRLLDPSLQCARFVYDELVKIAHRCESYQLARFPVLRRKVEETVGSFLREGLTPAETMIRHLIDMEEGKGSEGGGQGAAGAGAAGGALTAVAAGGGSPSTAAVASVAAVAAGEQLRSESHGKGSEGGGQGAAGVGAAGGALTAAAAGGGSPSTAAVASVAAAAKQRVMLMRKEGAGQGQGGQEQQQQQGGKQAATANGTVADKQVSPSLPPFCSQGPRGASHPSSEGRRATEDPTPLSQTSPLAPLRLAAVNGNQRASSHHLPLAPSPCHLLTGSSWGISSIFGGQERNRGGSVLSATALPSPLPRFPLILFIFHPSFPSHHRVLVGHFVHLRRHSTVWGQQAHSRASSSPPSPRISGSSWGISSIFGGQERNRGGNVSSATALTPFPLASPEPMSAPGGSAPNEPASTILLREALSAGGEVHLHTPLDPDVRGMVHALAIPHNDMPEGMRVGNRDASGGVKRGADGAVLRGGVQQALPSGGGMSEGRGDGEQEMHTQSRRGGQEQAQEQQQEQKQEQHAQLRGDGQQEQQQQREQPEGRGDESAGASARDVVFQVLDPAAQNEQQEQQQQQERESGLKRGTETSGDAARSDPFGGADDIGYVRREAGGNAAEGGERNMVVDDSVAAEAGARLELGGGDEKESEAQPMGRFVEDASASSLFPPITSTPFWSLSPCNCLPFPTLVSLSRTRPHPSLLLFFPALSLSSLMPFVLPKLLKRPPSILRASEQRSAEEGVEIGVTRLLLKSYYDIVRKNIQDAVPKAIMHFLVNHVKRELHSVFIQQLYREALFEEMLQEREDIASKRQRCKDIYAVLQQAAWTLDELPIDPDAPSRPSGPSLLLSPTLDELPLDPDAPSRPASSALDATGLPPSSGLLPPSPGYPSPAPSLPYRPALASAGGAGGGGGSSYGYGHGRGLSSREGGMAPIPYGTPSTHEQSHMTAVMNSVCFAIFKQSCHPQSLRTFSAYLP